MSVLNIINKARRLTYTDISQYTNTEWLEDLNEVYADLVTDIIQDVNEDYFYDEFTTDLVQWQYEYQFQAPTATTTGMNKVKELFVNYWAWYKEASQVVNLQFPADYLAVNQDKEHPIFTIKDNSVFLYPTPTQSINEWLKANVTIIPRDLLLTDTDTDIKIQRQYHKLLFFGLLPYVYQQIWMLNEKNDSLQTYERLKLDLINKLTDRNLSPLEVPMLSLESIS